MAELDVGLFAESPPADVFEQRPGKKEGVEAKIALGERIESRLLVSYGEARAPLDGACFQKIALDAGEQSFERGRASGEKRMCVPGLRRSGADIGSLRQRGPVERRDFGERRR